MKINNLELNKKLLVIIYEYSQSINKKIYYDIDKGNITTQDTAYNYSARESRKNKIIESVEEFNECIEICSKKENWDSEEAFKYISDIISVEKIYEDAKNKLTEDEYNEIVKLKNHKKIKRYGIREKEYIDTLFSSTLKDKDKISDILSAGTKDVNIAYIEDLAKKIENTELKQAEKEDFYYKFIKKRRNTANDTYKESLVCNFILKNYKNNEVYINKFKELIQNLHKFIEAQENKKDIINTESLYAIKINFDLENLYNTYITNDNSLYKINNMLTNIFENIKDLYNYKDLSITKLGNYSNTRTFEDVKGYRVLIANDEPIDKDFITKLIMKTYEKIYEIDKISDKHLISVISEVAIGLELEQVEVKNTTKSIKKI